MSKTTDFGFQKVAEDEKAAIGEFDDAVSVAVGSDTSGWHRGRDEGGVDGAGGAVDAHEPAGGGAVASAGASARAAAIKSAALPLRTSGLSRSSAIE